MIGRSETHDGKKYNWYKIAESIQEISFSGNAMAEIEVAGKIICVAIESSRLRACTQKCPHAGGILAEGFIDGLGDIVCPVHRYRFSLHNGRNTSGEGYFLKTFPIEVTNEGIYVRFDENKAV